VGIKLEIKSVFKSPQPLFEKEGPAHQIFPSLSKRG